MANKITAWIRRLFDRTGTGSDLHDPQKASPGEQAGDDFSSEMFVQLLLELPMHRREITESWQAGDLERLRNGVHRLLGATVYCAVPELEEALRDLRRALHAGDTSGIVRQHARALAVIDRSLSVSGCR